MTIIIKKLINLFNIYIKVSNNNYKIKMSFFENINDNDNKTYIVLFNNSYFSSTQINVDINNVDLNYNYNLANDKNKIKSHISIIDYQKKILQKYLIYEKCEKFYFMLWNNDVNIKNKDEITFDDYNKMNITYEMCGDSNLSNALKKIPYNWYQTEKDINIIIISTCDIWDDFIPQLKRISKTNININFLIVEYSNKEYDNNFLNDSCCMNLYNRIEKNFINKFYCWSEKYVEYPLIIYNNDNECKNRYLIPFGDKFFKFKNIYKFIKYIKKYICEIEIDEEIYELLKKIINTIKYLTQNESFETKIQRIQLFIDMFNNIKNKEIIDIVKTRLFDELNKPKMNNELGYIEFQKINSEYYDKIYSAIELYEYQKFTNNEIYNELQIKDTNVKVKKYNNNDWFSLPVYNNKNNTIEIFKTSNKNITSDIHFFDKKFKGCGLKINNTIIPMFPQSVLLVDKMDDINLEVEYIIYLLKTYYSKKNNINVNNYYIQYYFFADIFNILISDIPNDVKDIYRNLSLILLNKKRYGVNLTELEYLYDNIPGNNKKSDKQKYYFLKKIIKCSGIKDEISPYAWWFCFIKLLKDPLLEKNQYKLFMEHNENNKYNSDTIIDDVKKISLNVNYIDWKNDIIEYDYNCYYSLENIELEGGYIFTSHKIDEDLFCSPKLMLSKECYDVIKEDNKNIINCPICCKKIKMDKLSFIPNKENYYNESEKKKKEFEIHNNECDINKYEKITFDEKFYSSNENIKLKKMNECKLKTGNYEILHPQLIDLYYSKFVEIHEQEKFNKSVYNRYSFLKNIIWDGVCLSGGFCRSILLKQKIKDFDFFFYGKNFEINFINFMNNLLTNVKNKENDIKFLFLYKHQYNVFEVICIKDPGNFFHENFNLENFENYDFNSLYRYNKFIVINPQTNKLLRKVKNEYWTVNNKINNHNNIDTTNYFEDLDKNGIRIKYRFQFILCKFDSIEKVLENFDMEPCRVAWDGKTTWFTEGSELSYRYMSNVVNEKILNTDEYRLGKYFSYGFKIILPKLNMDKLKSNHDYLSEKKIKLCKLEFNVKGIDKQKIIVKHNSHIKKQLQKIEELEKKNIENGKYLYKSFWFCSLISILRYIRIQKISYKFSDKILLPFDDGFFSFAENDDYVKFKDTIKNKIYTLNIYGDLKK